MSKKKTILEESTIRRFMKLASIDALSEKLGKKSVDVSAPARQNGDPLTKMDSISIKGASNYLKVNPDQSFGKWIRSSVPSSMKTGGNTDKIIGMYDKWQGRRSGAEDVLNTFISMISSS